MFKIGQYAYSFIPIAALIGMMSGIWIDKSQLDLLLAWLMPVLTLATVILLYVYTRETYLLRKETQSQSNASYTPYLALRNTDDGATFANLGKGIAKEIEVEKSILVREQPILLIPSIAAGENRKLYHFSDDRDGAFGLYANELPDEIRVTYSDLLGNKYSAKFRREYDGMGVYREIEQGKAF